MLKKHCGNRRMFAVPHCSDMQWCVEKTCCSACPLLPSHQQSNVAMSSRHYVQRNQGADCYHYYLQP